MTYAIKVTPDYYGSTCNAPQEALITRRDLSDDYQSMDTDIAEYETEDEAQAVIDDKLETDSVYHLSHGEAGAPSYEVVDLDDALRADCYNASGEGFYDFNEIDPDDLPDDVQDKLDGLNVEYHRSGDDYDVYTDTITINDIRYMIVFCPTTIALQLNSDDLGGVDWDHQAYFVEE